MENQTKPTILYVDDEVNNLTGFHAGFRRKYNVFTAQSAEAGLELIQKNDIQIVIADQRMPKVTGVEFLQQIRNSHPDIVRILLTGYTDAEAIIDAINKGHIYRYINKPWDELELENAINNAYDIFSTRQKLKLKMAELQKVNDELNRFVYSTAHDLRSPLASILGILDLIKSEGNSEDQNEYLTIIENCAEKINLYIRKIIEYYKNLRFDESRDLIDYTTVIEKTVQPLRLQHPEIDFEIEINQQQRFVNDLFRITVILDNLISNAVKFLKPGSENQTVKIKIDVDKDSATISIEDNGKGIKKEFLESVFQMFFRTENTTEGLGIGLFIVKEALQKIQGTIDVDSVDGEGSVFKIEVPNLDAAQMN